EWLSYFSGTRFSADLLLPDDRPVDLAWNDADLYKEFFETFWPVLNPNGGIMVFHNTVSRKYCWEAIQWMKMQCASTNDLEILTLPETHKLDQSGCTILRRTTGYKPPCLTRYPQDILENARE